MQLSFLSLSPEQKKELAKVEEYLDPTEDREARKETHRASNQTKLTFQSYLLVSLNLVICGRVEVNQNVLEIHISMQRPGTWERFLEKRTCLGAWEPQSYASLKVTVTGVKCE